MLPNILIPSLLHRPSRISPVKPMADPNQSKPMKTGWVAEPKAYQRLPGAFSKLQILKHKQNQTQSAAICTN